MTISTINNSLKTPKARILIMDDEEMILDLAKQALTATGYEVETATNGQSAIDLYQQAHNTTQAYDCLIMDLTVPGGLGGEQAFKKIRIIDPMAKGIVSSGFEMDPVMENYADYGFKATIAKPFTLASLREVVEKVVNQS